MSANGDMELIRPTVIKPTDKALFIEYRRRKEREKLVS